MLSGEFLEKNYLRILIKGPKPTAQLVWIGSPGTDEDFEGFVMNSATGETIQEALDNLMEQMTESRMETLTYSPAS